MTNIIIVAFQVIEEGEGLLMGIYYYGSDDVMEEDNVLTVLVIGVVGVRNGEDSLLTWLMWLKRPKELEHHGVGQDT